MPAESRTTRTSAVAADVVGCSVSPASLALSAMRSARACAIGSLLSYPTDQVGSACDLISLMAGPCQICVGGKHKPIAAHPVRQEYWPRVAPRPAAARCGSKPDLRSAPAPGAAVVRPATAHRELNTSAINSIGSELSILRPSIETRCVCSGADLHQLCLSQFQRDQLVWSSSCPSRSSIESRNARPRQ